MDVDKVVELKLCVHQLRDEKRQHSRGQHIHRQPVAFVAHHHLIYFYKKSNKIKQIIKPTFSFNIVQIDYIGFNDSNLKLVIS